MTSIRWKNFGENKGKFVPYEYKNFKIQDTKNKRAKIRGFYTTIHGFLLSKFRKKTVSK